ncbi:subtilisin-like protein [Colletotrichum caudatum]|nr:subtilisin-like protein [Colletotrichum caudatum]
MNTPMKTWSSYGIFQEVARSLKEGEKNMELRIFYAEVMAYCAMIREHCYRAGLASNDIDDKLFELSLQCLESTITKNVLRRPGKFVSERQSAPSLSRFESLWSETAFRDSRRRMELIHRAIDFGSTPEERQNFLASLIFCEEEIQRRYPEDTSQWPKDDFKPPTKISQPSYAIWGAAKTIFKALAKASRECDCALSHEFGVRLRLGTYRKPQLGTDLDNEHNLDLHISRQGPWHTTRFHAKKESTVQWASNGEIKSPMSKLTKPMRIKTLCEFFNKIDIKTVAFVRFELEATKERLYKRRSERVNQEFDATKKAISLEDFLRSRSRRLTEKTKRILAVILSSAVLHLENTSWLPTDWGSSDVLFFHAASSTGIPLRPFIKTRIPEQEPTETGRLSVVAELGSQNTLVDQADSDSSAESDDIDPDDLSLHKCPVMVTLAIMLMEVWFGIPFDELAQKFSVQLAEDIEPSNFLKCLDASLVFEKCGEEIPENSQFHKAIKNCLEPNVWVEEDGSEIEAYELRTRIYEQVVKPLETELTQAYSSIAMDELDEIAANLDIANWDDPIRMFPPQQTEAVISRESLLHAAESGNTHSPSSTASLSSIRVSRPHTRTQPTYTPQPYHIPVIYIQSPSSTPLTSYSPPVELNWQASQFFDDVRVTDTQTQEAYKYRGWKANYDDVYERFIPVESLSAMSYLAPVKIAVLDTGIDMNHPDLEARMENIKGKYNWLSEVHKTMVHDSSGHGTFTACLLLDYAPDAELFVAKIAEKDPLRPKIIANAIDFAINTWGVDIISMSFGFPDKQTEGYHDLEKALQDAHRNNVLLFAAASNSGGRQDRAFPARNPDVIAVHSTDTNGNRSDFSPSGKLYDISLATVGEGVESAWPISMCDRSANPTFVECKYGTSYATPIMAGIAAFLLLYARIRLPKEAHSLKNNNYMKALLTKIAEKGTQYKSRDNYHFVDLSLNADGLFGHSNDFIDNVIKTIVQSI